MPRINKLFIDIEVETYKLEKAKELIKELKALGLTKKTLNLLIKDITRKYVIEE